MKKRNKPKVVYTQKLAKNYEKNRSSNAGDVAFWKKEQQELQFGIQSSEPNIREVMEAGCGTGRFIPDMANKGYVVFGIDLSHHMLRMAGKKIKNKKFNCSIIRADISHLPFDHFKVNFVYSIRVMNQLPSTDYAHEAIREILRVCENPGSILLEYVNRWSLSRLSLEPSVYLSIRDIEKILRQEGNYRLIYVRGILFFSQTLWERLPRLILSPFVKLDSFLCKLMPMFSTRCYVLIKKERTETITA